MLLQAAFPRHAGLFLNGSTKKKKKKWTHWWKIGKQEERRCLVLCSCLLHCCRSLRTSPLPAPAPGHSPCFLEAGEHALLPGPYDLGVAIPSYSSLGDLSFLSELSAPLSPMCTLSLRGSHSLISLTCLRNLSYGHHAMCWVLFYFRNDTQHYHLPQ